MYPTASRQADRSNIQGDLEYLVKTVEDPQHKPYLKGPLVDSLKSLGHSASEAQAAVDAYYKVSIQ